jgi:hypothetical protein
LRDRVVKESLRNDLRFIFREGKNRNLSDLILLKELQNRARGLTQSAFQSWVQVTVFLQEEDPEIFDRLGISTLATESHQPPKARDIPKGEESDVSS